MTLRFKRYNNRFCLGVQNQKVDENDDHRQLSITTRKHNESGWFLPQLRCFGWLTRMMLHRQRIEAISRVPYSRQFFETRVLPDLEYDGFEK